MLDWSDALSGGGSEAATIVNTTSLGMAGEPDLALDFGAIAPGTLVTDLVYGAEPTPFVLEARRRGLVAVDGLGMLLHQAVPGFERWFGHRPEVDAALRAAVLA